MGLCCSSPVADAQHSARSSVDAPQDGQAGRNRQKGGFQDQGKGGRAGETNAKGRRASVDWNKPILGQFDDVKERYAFEKVLGKG